MVQREIRLFRCVDSQGLVFSLKNIFDTTINANYKLLYVPALIPFVVFVLITIPVFALSAKAMLKRFSQSSFKQTRNPFLALVGALIMVNLMLVGGDNSMVNHWTSFADATGEYWTWFASYLGAVGAFFSGSNTVSNLTFGSVQLSTAQITGLSASVVLALQSVGSAMGT